MRSWDHYLSEADARVFEASGYGARAGLGTRPALVIIDVNYAFCGDRALPVLESLDKWRNSCGERAWEAIPHIRRLIDQAHVNRVPVVYTTGQERRRDRFDAGVWRHKNRRSGEQEGLPGFPRNEIVREIAPIESDIVIRKPKPSAFFSTPLNSFLVDLGVDSLLLCGVTTSGCVRATAVDGFSGNYRVAVVEQACFDRIEASHAMALFDLQSTYADVLHVDEAVEYLAGTRTGLYDELIDFGVEHE